jgi:hypothetical protein
LLTATRVGAGGSKVTLAKLDGQSASISISITLPRWTKRSKHGLDVQLRRLRQPEARSPPSSGRAEFASGDHARQCGRRGHQGQMVVTGNFDFPA